MLTGKRRAWFVWPAEWLREWRAWWLGKRRCPECGTRRHANLETTYPGWRVWFCKYCRISFGEKL